MTSSDPNNASNLETSSQTETTPVQDTTSDPVADAGQTGSMDSDILATQQARNKLIKKVALLCFGAVFSVFAVYKVGVFLGGQLASSAGEHSDQKLAASEDILDVARDELQQMLVLAENLVKDIEQDQGRNNWDAAGITSLRNTLQLAYGSYSAENYQQAGKQLKQLQSAVAVFEEHYQQQWQAAFEQALTAWHHQDITEARLQNQTTLNLNPGHVPAQELQARLDVWQEVSDKLEALRVAEVENNPEKQLSIAQQILQLDPQNRDIETKVKQLETQLKERRYAAAIAEARNMLSDGDREAAQTALNRAKSIYGNRAENDQIQVQLDEIARDGSVARLLQQITTMQSVDNWVAAQKISKTAKNQHPENAQFELSYQLATQILDYQKQLSSYLQSPARLTDDNIRNNASQLLAQVADLEVASAGLKTQADQLRDVMSDSFQKMPVTVISDGRTDIRVLGTGVVGKTKQKVIQLLPGNYRFEGRRKGYQSKIITFTVRATDEQQSITLICDEKI